MTRACLCLACGRLAHGRKRAATGRALCGDEASHARLPRVLPALRWFEVAFTLWKVAAQEKRPLSFGARQWFNAPASRTAGLSARVCTRERATVLALCREEAQDTRLSHARTAPRGLEFALGL